MAMKRFIPDCSANRRAGGASARCGKLRGGAVGDERPEFILRQLPGGHVISHISQIGVYVTDQDAALSFYTEKLGFEVRKLQDGGDFKWIEVAPPGSPTTISLATKDFPVGTESKIGGFTDIAFETADIKALHETLSQRGVRFTVEPELQPYGKWFAAFVDQDDNEFFVFQPA
ncbi:VOC family protein [Saccharopolyspora shandongensis]|uniref:VOC family protein n=1 Tax=Saccharopolyspora shandongensis TaxID=418495 RepID=UPI001C43164F|nr:VOC family protein [Saccharopolyspora shandongensis]